MVHVAAMTPAIPTGGFPGLTQTLQVNVERTSFETLHSVDIRRHM